RRLPVGGESAKRSFAATKGHQVTAPPGTAVMNVPRRPTLPLLAALLLLPGCGDPGDPDEKRAVEAPYGQGLKYVDLLGGDGEQVKEGDVVEVRYTGMLHADGKPFEGNAAEGKPPLRFLVGNGDVVRGFDAGVVGMHPGGKRKLFIPS